MQEETEWDTIKAESNARKHRKKNLENIISECEANAIPDSEIDTSEIPPVTDFSGFQFGNPMLREPQNEQVSLRINKILLAHFRSKGKGWQKQLNDFLMTAYLNGQI